MNNRSDGAIDVPSTNGTVTGQLKCWRCDKSDLDVIAYAQQEVPKKPYLDLHPACADEMGIGGELLPVVIEESVGDI